MSPSRTPTPLDQVSHEMARGVARTFAILVILALATASLTSVGGAPRGDGIPPGARIIGVSTGRHHEAPPSVAPLPDGVTRRAPAQAATHLVAIWVTRWDFSNAADIEKIMRNCRALGVNTVFFQVRGAGTAYWRSAIEPWAWELTSKTPATTGRDPGWDPLAVAVAAAHRHGLALHAYINVLPGWNGAASPPPAAGQLWTARRDWFMVGENGRGMDAAKWYTFLDPALPEVRDYLARLAGELAARYAIDGLHLDYVRYPGDHGDYGYGARSLALYKADTGKAPRASRWAWNRWRATQVERCVAGMTRAAKAARPGLVVSASVFADPPVARDKHCQPSWEWALGRTVDILFPMNYAEKRGTYHERAAHFGRTVRGAHLGMGLRATESAQEIAARATEARRLGAQHIALFAYSDFYPNHAPNAKARALAGRLR